MIAKDLINYMIPPLKPLDRISKARQWMEELRLSELPVIDGENFVGIIDEEMIFDETFKYEQVGAYPLIGQDCQVHAGVHYYDVLKTSTVEGFRIVAVVDENHHYLGVVSVEDIVDAFARNASVSTPGAIINLRLKFQDYSLAEISRIIETYEAKVLSSYLSPHPEDPAELQLTLKINKEDISHIVTLLEQGGFHVETSFNTVNNRFDEKERIEGLMKYLKL